MAIIIEWVVHSVLIAFPLSDMTLDFYSSALGCLPNFSVANIMEFTVPSMLVNAIPMFSLVVLDLWVVFVVQKNIRDIYGKNTLGGKCS